MFVRMTNVWSISLDICGSHTKLFTSSTSDLISHTLHYNKAFPWWTNEAWHRCYIPNQEWLPFCWVFFFSSLVLSSNQIVEVSHWWHLLLTPPLPSKQTTKNGWWDPLNYTQSQWGWDPLSYTQSQWVFLLLWVGVTTIFIILLSLCTVSVLLC